MTTDFYRNFIKQSLQKADIEINGSRPWDIIIQDESFYKRVFRKGSLGLGESYMEEVWSCRQLDECLFRLISSNVAASFKWNFEEMLYWVEARMFNLQSAFRSKMVAQKHYNIGNKLYEAMLDSRMVYSCAYWQDALNLDDAQEAKLDLICRKLKLREGETVLDIGCGWGGFVKYAAEKYKVKALGITISEEQLVKANELCAGLPVEIRLQDYRNLEGKFDKIVSIGMFEHVGYKNYQNYMNIVHRILNNDGLFLLHCIGGNKSVIVTDPWINKYIFPNGMIPSPYQISKATQGKFILEDWHSLGFHYDRTLMEWLKRFNESWPELESIYDKRFYNMWVYYLSCSAASFRAKTNNLWQIVFSRTDGRINYQSVR